MADCRPLGSGRTEKMVFFDSRPNWAAESKQKYCHSLAALARGKSSSVVRDMRRLIASLATLALYLVLDGTHFYYLTSYIIIYE